MIKINDYATKNHLNEWEIKDLPDGDVYGLDLQDLGIIFALPTSLGGKKIYIPTYLSIETAKKLENFFYIFFGRANEPKVYLLNCDYKIGYKENATGFCSIIPDYKAIIKSLPNYEEMKNEMLKLGDQDSVEMIKKYRKSLLS